MRKAFFIGFVLLTFQGMAVCTGLWSRVRLKEAPSYTTANKTFIVDIEVLIDASGSCVFPGNSVGYYIFTGCGQKLKRTAQTSNAFSPQTTQDICAPHQQYTQGALQTFYFTDTFSLHSLSSCPDMLVYFRSTDVTYHNIDTLNAQTPDGSWVWWSLSARNKPLMPDTNLRVLQACLHQTRHYSPAYADGDGDSLHFRVAKISWYDTSATGIPMSHYTDFRFPFSRSMPLPSHDFTIKDKDLSFTPFDTGFYALPITVDEWSLRDSTLQMPQKVAISYFQIPVYISDSCFPGLYYFGLLGKDTMAIDCRQRRVKVPFTDAVLAKSISPDGTDFKFENDSGYPVILHKVHIPKDTLFVDEITLDIQFFFDGVYRFWVISGSDNNTVFNQCGYELQESTIYEFALTGCPNVVDVGMPEDEYKIGVYPNPFTEKLKIEGSSANIRNLAIVNALGQTVPFKLSTSEGIINVPHDLPKGVYFLKVELEGGFKSGFKLLKN